MSKRGRKQASVAVNAYIFGIGVVRGNSYMVTDEDERVVVSHLYETLTKGCRVLRSLVDARQVVESKYQGWTYGYSDLLPAECTDVAMDSAKAKKKKTHRGFVVETEVWKDPITDDEFLEETAGCPRGLSVVEQIGKTIVESFYEGMFPSKEVVQDDYKESAYDPEKDRMNAAFRSAVAQRARCGAVLMDDGYRSSVPLLQSQAADSVWVPNPCEAGDCAGVTTVNLSICDFLYDHDAFRANFLIDHTAQPPNVSLTLVAMLEAGWLFEGQIIEITYNNRRMNDQWSAAKALRVFQRALRGFFHLAPLEPFTFYKRNSMAWGLFEVRLG